MNLAEYPTGYITIVFTDIVGSSKMTERLNATERARYETELRNPHRDRLYALLSKHRGYEIQRAGDGHMCVFHTPQEAIACLKEFQEQLRDDPLTVEFEGEEFTVQVRAGIHTSERTMEPEEENGRVDYSGGDLNFAARVSALGDGGQILLSQSTVDKATPEITKEMLHPWLGRYLKSFEHAPQTVYELLYYDGQEPREPGMRFFSAFYQDERNRYIERKAEEDAVINCFVNAVRGVRPRLVTIHAEGGMGKTRLSIACAKRVAGAFKDGIHFVRLGLSQPGAQAVAEAIGEVFGWHGPQAQPDAVCAALRHQNVLLLLDNYESCASDEAALFLSRLISETTGVHLLVTSRQIVGVRNIEQQVALDAGLTKAQARELFLERAALDPKRDRPLYAAEEPHFERLLRLISVEPGDENSGPIPLAVELAAAWWSEKELKEIADGIEETPLKKYMEPVPGTVADNHAETQGRHDSLERSLEWSFDLLGKIPDIGPRLQETFAFCGLFPDVFDSETVQRVGQYEDADDLLIRLHRASLLQKRDSEGRTRYRLHRFTREYTRQKLEELPVGTDLKARFTAYYAVFTNDHKDINSADNRAALDAVWRNALAAVELAALTKDWSSLANLWIGLRKFLELRGLFSERETLFKLALSLARELGLRQAEGAALNNLGSVYLNQGLWTEAEAAYQQSLVIRREFGDRIGEGQTLNNLGNVYDSQGLWTEAEAAYQQSLVICREFGDRIGEGKTLENIALLSEATGDLLGAVELARQAVGVLKETQAVASFKKAQHTLSTLEAKLKDSQ